MLALTQWIGDNKLLVSGMVVGSVALFVAALIAMPMFIARLPSDAFVRAEPEPLVAAGHPAVRVALRIGRNVLGAVLIVVGALMLVLPGQGLLMLLAGVMLADVPGKRRVLRWIAARPSVLRTLNWLRRRAGKEPFVVD